VLAVVAAVALAVAAVVAAAVTVAVAAVCKVYYCCCRINSSSVSIESLYQCRLLYQRALCAL
jgi:hypothetical protein